MPVTAQYGSRCWDGKGTDTLEPVFGALLARKADIRASSDSDRHGRVEGRGWGRSPGSNHVTQVPCVPKTRHHLPETSGTVLQNDLGSNLDLR